MDCPNQVKHTLQRGDTLYRLAKYYHTDVEKILEQNPAISPSNFRVGMDVTICPGKAFRTKYVETAQVETAQVDEVSDEADAESDRNLSNRMRLAWSQHVYWTRMLLISIAARLDDQEDVTRRLLRNPRDIAAIYADFYPEDVTRIIINLLTEHLRIAANLITALRDGNKVQADALDRQWHVNADEIADALSSINPYYDRETLRGMLYRHLNLTTKEVATYLAGNYADSTNAFDQVEQEALSMADYLTNGLVRISEQ